MLLSIYVELGVTWPLPDLVINQLWKAIFIEMILTFSRTCIGSTVAWSSFGPNTSSIDIANTFWIAAMKGTRLKISFELNGKWSKPTTCNFSVILAAKLGGKRNFTWENGRIFNRNVHCLAERKKTAYFHQVDRQLFMIVKHSIFKTAEIPELFFYRLFSLTLIHGIWFMSFT